MRLPLIPELKVDLEQRTLYEAFIKRVGKNFMTFKTVRDDGALLGPWSVWLHVPTTGEAIRQYIEAVEAMPGLSKRTVQVVVLVTGSHFNAAYEMYAHASVGAQAGLSADQIATLCAGKIPVDLDAEATLAAKVASKLLKGGVLPGPLYKHAVAELGQDGLNHLVYVVGQYCIVSMSLNAFDVPAEE